MWHESLMRKWKSEETVKPEHFLILAMVKNGNSWKNVIGQRVWANGSKLGEI